MLVLLDWAGETYSQFMAIVNYICFGAVCVCLVIVFVMITLGQFSHYHKTLAISTLTVAILLIMIHWILVNNFGITLLVPPIGTPYFNEFMHVVQYISSIMVVILAAFTFLMAVLSRVDHWYQHGFVSGFAYLILLGLIHWYILDNFGIPLIFPPTLW
ncbi:MAG: hypothetical protein ACTSQI_15145 [Candidatus Helarchaeota archaeon]